MDFFFLSLCLHCYKQVSISLFCNANASVGEDKFVNNAQAFEGKNIQIRLFEKSVADGLNTLAAPVSR